MKYVLVLDIAKGKSMFMLSSDVGEVLLEPTEYIHNKTNFESIDSYINKLDIKDNLTVVMEATSIYHKAPERFFKENNYHVIVFNPLIGKEITNTIRKTKTDKQDCIKLTNLFWKGSIPDRNYTEEEIYTRLIELSRQYYHLDEGLTRHKNRYKELLHLCFPEFKLCFKDGKIYDFEPSMADDPDFSYMLPALSDARFTIEQYQPFVIFNLNISKEIGDALTASFYVNNLFNSHPLYKTKASGSYVDITADVPIFFGFELKVSIK